MAAVLAVALALVLVAQALLQLVAALAVAGLVHRLALVHALGAVLAMLVFLGMPAIMDLLGGGAVSAVEMQRLIGTGSLDAAGYLLMLLVVIIIAGLCMITSRVGVYRILNSQH